MVDSSLPSKGDEQPHDMSNIQQALDSSTHNGVIEGEKKTHVEDGTGTAAIGNDMDDEETATESDSYLEKTTRHSWGAEEGGPSSASHGEVVSRKRATRGGYRGAISVKLLIDEGILAPGDGVLSVEYKGMVRTADLLEDGRIRVDIDGDIMMFDSPSAFSIFIKRLVNPTRKADDGWKSVKYNGTLLEKFKVELAKQSLPFDESVEKRQKIVVAEQPVPPASPERAPRVRNVEHAGVGADSTEYTVELREYSEPQPFDLCVSPFAEAIIDFHAHLCYDEVMGVLMGTVSEDASRKKVTVLTAVPIAVKNDSIYQKVSRVQMDADEMESQVKKLADDGSLQCVGSYHSHPDFAPLPTIIDTLSFVRDAHKVSCRVEAIVSPYDPAHADASAPITWYHVNIPPSAGMKDGLPDDVDPATLGCVPYRLQYTSSEGDTAANAASLQKVVEDLAKKYAPAHNRANIEGLWKKTDDGSVILRIDKMIESFRDKLSKGTQLEGKLNSFVTYKLDVLVRAVWSVYGRKDTDNTLSSDGHQKPTDPSVLHQSSGGQDADDDEPISDDNTE
ncbi:MPN domain-containing protein [Picochlorum sp. SENEW3]|nr:MPN domain-containing protein [Picochlorum sp. SENEW3]